MSVRGFTRHAGFPSTSNCGTARQVGPVHHQGIADMSGLSNGKVEMAKKKRKTRITYAQVEAGLNPIRDFGQKWYRYVSPIDYILECKETGIADWKIAHDLSIDSGVEVATTTVYLWRRKGERV